jgi:hypothetical protein
MVPAQTLEVLYHDLYLCAQRGLTNKEMAASVGVLPERVSKWLKENPDFALMIEETRGKGPVANVEGALIMKATGYDARECTDTYELVNGDLELVKKVVSVKHVSPDTNAAKFFLKNRGENWREKVEVDTNQEINISFDPAAKDI